MVVREDEGASQWLSPAAAGLWLSSAAASCCAVAGGKYGLDYYRRRLGHGISGGLGFDFFPLSLSLSLWVFTVGKKYRIFFWQTPVNIFSQLICNFLIKNMPHH